MVCHLALLECSPATDLLAGGEAEAPPTVRGPETVELLLDGALLPGSPVPTTPSPAVVHPASQGALCLQ